MIISLTGFMGCGKSSVGRRLSTLLYCSYMDLDAYIEEESGRSIPEIFASDGEGAFRAMELEALQQLLHMPDFAATAVSSEGPLPQSGPLPLPGGGMILSLGGGTVMTPQCAEIVHEQTLCIYLRASVETLMSHLAGETAGRPMLNSGKSTEESESEALRKRITELMNIRSATYEKTAHIIIDIDGKEIEDICSEMIASIEALG